MTVVGLAPAATGNERSAAAARAATGAIRIIDARRPG
jgi:hypothetical protein